MPLGPLQVYVPELIFADLLDVPFMDLVGVPPSPAVDN